MPGNELIIKRKILFIIPAFNMGGTNKVLINTLSLLSKKEYDVSLLVMYPIGSLKNAFSNENTLNNGYLLSCFAESVNKVLFNNRIGFMKYLNRFVFKILRRIIGESFLRDFIYYFEGKRLDKLNFDTIVAFQERDATWLASSIKKTKTIAWIHCDYNEHLKRVLLDEFHIYDSFTYIVCVSDFTKNTFISKYPLLNSKTLSITNPVNERAIMEQSTLPSNLVHKINFKIFSIVSIGRLSKVKQFSLIPSIAFQLKSLGCEFVWYIIGAGDEHDHILNMISKHNMKDTVIMLGELSNPFYLIKQVDLIVSTSHSEACPTVFNEAKVLNTPIVTTNFPSANEFIISGTNGIITNLQNMAKEISYMINNSDHYNSIKCNTRIATNLNKTISKRYYELF